MGSQAKKTARRGSIAYADRRDNPETYARRSVPHSNPPSETSQIRLDVGRVLTAHPAFTGDTSGRVVMCPTDNDAWHLFWKWSRGEWAGWYVYWYLPRGEPLSAGLIELSCRYEQVLAGDRRPIKDTPRPSD